MRLRKRDFVNFQATALPTTSPSLLNPAHKLPIYATGLFSVENKYQRYTWLPGFYRTFATREHALLCQVAARKFLQVADISQKAKQVSGMFFLRRVTSNRSVGANYALAKPCDQRLRLRTN